MGLTEKLIGDDCPNLKYYYQQNKQYLKPPIPAVTCTSQATLLTGKSPEEHGVVANGWYFRDLAQVWLWRQTNQLVEGEKVWETLKKEIPGFNCAKMFWWYNMYSSADFSATPRPIYRADGLKYPGSYTYPADLNDKLENKLGTFPLFKFWGPMTTIESSKWIADSTIYIMEKEQPSLALSYLPHLDYNLQRLGPNHPDIAKDVKELDECIGHLRACAEKNNYRVLILSEYGIQDVDTPVHINRELRKAGYISIRTECGEEHFDAGASQAFAVADHQLAHVYVNDDEKLNEIKQKLLSLDGVAEVLSGEERSKYGLNHERAGEIVCLSEKNAWFTYYYWLNDELAPDYAKTVDIHRKPGYDPVELFMEPDGKFKAFKALIKKKLGFRYMMNVIPLDAHLVKGSHGVYTESLEDGPLLIGDIPLGESNQRDMKDFKSLVEQFFLG